jgi:cell division septum initiation protein DivIVA
MELTPEKFEKAEFTERRRGYDIDQVETFLEETGTEFAQMLAKFRHTEQRAAAAEERAAAAESRLAQTDAIVAEATERVQRAERAARAAQQQAAEAQSAAANAAAEGAAGVARANEAAEVEQAAKTLLMAQRTADATVNEARGQAQALLEDARARADRQQAESAAEAEELVRLARLQAEEEYADRRSAIIDEVRGLEARRAQLSDVITQLEARLAGYRSELTRTAEEIASLAGDPSRLGARPNMSIPPDEVLSAGEPVGAGDTLTDAASSDVDDEVADYLGTSGSSTDAGESAGSWTDTAAVPSVDPSESSPSASAASSSSEPLDGGEGGSGGTGPGDAQAANGAGAADAGYVDLTAPSGRSAEPVAAGDSWGPGSWSQIESELGADEQDDERHGDVISATAATSSVRAANGSSSARVAQERSARAEAASAPAPAPSPEVLSANDDELVDDRPTQAVEQADAHRDRYMQALDEAVNDEGTGDDAMTAFFEGTNDSKTRRFGWRR